MKFFLQLFNTRKTLHYLIFLIAVLNTNLFAVEAESLTIGFGSCAKQRNKQLIWNKISAHKPDLFILTGDNVYIDSPEPSEMAKAYQMLADNPNFSAFKAVTPLIATWDDHDYGIADGGSEFAAKELSKSAFIKFFDYPEINQIKARDGGIYHSRWIDFHQQKIQIILLDTRWYRDPLERSYLTLEQRKLINLGPYQPTMDKSKTLLGQAQWDWLENELKKPADLRLLISSIQVLNEFSGWETWANFPHERIKLLDLLHAYNNENILIISGDIHKAEISQLNYKDQIFRDITSSGLDARTYPKSINNHRIGKTLEEKNYGILEIQDNGKLTVRATIYNEKGKAKLTTKLGE